jgi:hypothetical protein
MAKTRLAGMSRALAGRIVFGILILVAAEVGGWAQIAPRSFWRTFPGFGHHWLPPLGPYNEHAMRDFGGLNLALAAVTLVALVTLGRAAVAAAVIAWELYSVPHLAFHLAHLSPYSRVDAVANITSLIATVVLPVAGFVLVRSAWADPAAHRSARVP